MILVDTSVWIDHLRSGDELLAQLLARGQVGMHPMVVGELACGNLQSRQELIGLWQNLPRIAEVSHAEALFCLHRHQLMGRGIGFVDLHLLASTLLVPGSLLWTRDRRLDEIAREFNLGFDSGTG